MPLIAVPEVLREKLGVEGAQALVDLYNRMQAEEEADILKFVEEKFERRLSEEIGALRVEMAQKFADLREEIAQKIAGLETKIAQNTASLEAKIAQNTASLEAKIAQNTASLEAKIAQNTASLIKWMFIFWVGQVAVIVGILFAFFK